MSLNPGRSAPPPKRQRVDEVTQVEQGMHRLTMGQVEWRMHQLAFISDLPSETHHEVHPEQPRATAHKIPAEPPRVKPLSEIDPELFAKLTEELMEELEDEAVKDATRALLAGKFMAEHTSLAPLREHDLTRAQFLQRSRNYGQHVIVADENFDRQLDEADLASLRDGAWVNSAVIDAYLWRLVERSERLRAIPGQTHIPRIHAFGTILYVTLVEHTPGGEIAKNSYKYSEVSNMSMDAGVKLLECDKVLIPVHLHKNHWTLAVINVRDKRFEFYDSLGNDSESGHRIALKEATEVLGFFRQYLTDEQQIHSPKIPLDLTEWVDYIPSARDGTMPRQRNTIDCGIFVMKVAERLALDLPLDFSQADIPYLRRRMALELVDARRVL